MSEQLYKILVNGGSCHGGRLKWSLPKDDKPGKWHSVKGDISICKNGIHLTSSPYKWYTWGCTSYYAEAKDIAKWDGNKCVCRSARLIAEAPHPKWWTDAISFVDTLKDVKWFDNHGDVNPQWKMFETWDAARDAAWGAARDAAWDAAWGAARGAARDAAWGAARGAALKTLMLVCQDLKIDKSYRTFVDEMWHILTAGYGYFGTVNGVHYVYRRP